MNPLCTILRTAAVLMLTCCAVGCHNWKDSWKQLQIGSYRIGAHTLFAADVHTVYVPIFQSDVVDSDMAERLTEAVCKRIEAKSPYKVVGTPLADSVLEGKIVRKTTSVTIRNGYGDPRQMTKTLSVEIRWKDSRNRDLRPFDDVSWNEGAGTAIASSYMMAEIGQSELTADQRQIELIAAEIVGMMEVPW